MPIRVAEVIIKITAKIVVATTAESNNQVYYVHCNSSGGQNNPTNLLCSQTITLAPSYIYYLHLQDFYGNNNATITATNADGTVSTFSGAQVQIDSTGEASGQFKRVVENVCISQYCNTASVAGGGAAIQSYECIYKHFTTYATDPSTKPSDTPATESC